MMKKILFFTFCWPVNGIDLFWTDCIGYITTSE